MLKKSGSDRCMCAFLPFTDPKCKLFSYIQPFLFYFWHTNSASGSMFVPLKWLFKKAGWDLCHGLLWQCLRGVMNKYIWKHKKSTIHIFWIFKETNKKPVTVKSGIIIIIIRINNGNNLTIIYYLLLILFIRSWHNNNSCC